MPCVENWNSKPLEIIQNIFENRKDGVNWMKQVIRYFDNRLKNHSSLNVIPSLNDTQLHDLQSGTLVRFRCMVQETFEPEYFMENYEITHKTNGSKRLCSAAFRDIVDIKDDYDITSNTMGCRQVLYCVVIPAETNWVKEKFQSNSSSVAACSQPVNQSLMNSGKRGLDEEENEAMEQDQPMTNGVDHSKRQKHASNAEDQSSRTPLKKNHPLPDEHGTVCIVKVYDEEADFKINEIYEFVGVLSLDSSLEYVHDENGIDPDIDEEQRAHHPPPSFAPRLHCVQKTKLNHNNPLLWNNSAMTSVCTDIVYLPYTPLIHERTTVLAEENIGEYFLTIGYCRGEKCETDESKTVTSFLCAVCGAKSFENIVYSRTGAMAVGKFSLNITNISVSPKYPLYLAHLLKQLLTKVFYFPMTLENLNKNTFIPTKNYSTNKLDSGILQLSGGTHIVIDETVLKPGQLDSNGVKHVQAFCSLLNFQKVDYNFQFHPLSFEHDVPVLVLSDGKSLLPCDFQISLMPTTPVPDDLDKHFELLNPTLDLLDKFRTYLTFAKLDDYELSEDMMKVIENDFVAARQERSEKMTADDLHMHLIVARMLSINSGLKNLSMETWKKVGLLEANRKCRLGQS